MKLNIQTLTGQGKRKNNEDSVLSDPAQNLFLVCDGVGGSNKGEVASATACQSIQQYFAQHINGAISQNDINIAINTAENNFDGHVAEHPESAGMATTLTLLYFNNNTATVAHVGDSRVYHVRNGKIMYKTFDHSLVNELLASGNITEQQAKEHPNKNMITRALQGTQQPAIADVKIITDLQPSDFFLLCTDGVLESIDDKYITEDFVDANTAADLVHRIEEFCSQNSRDNFSAILIKIEKLEKTDNAIADDVAPKLVEISQNNTALLDTDTPTEVVKVVSDEPLYLQRKIKIMHGPNYYRNILSAVVLVLIISSGIYYITTRKNPTPPPVTAANGNHSNDSIKPPGVPTSVKPSGDNHTSSAQLVHTTGTTIGHEQIGALKQFKKDNKYGFKAGNSIVINPDFDTVHDFIHSLAAVKINDKWGFINKNGQSVVSPMYDDVSDFSQHLAGVKKNGKWGYIDAKGIIVIPFMFDNAWPFVNGMAAISADNKWGLIGKTGNPIIPIIYDAVSDFSGKKIHVKKDGEEYDIDKDNQRIK